jgi:hypothetical protein
MPRRHPDYLPQARAVWRDQHDIEVQAEAPARPGSVTKPRSSVTKSKPTPAEPAKADPAGVVSVTPARIADSRAGLQIPGAVGAVPVQVTGRGGIPDGGVAAVLATVTVVAPQQAGYITVWPSGSTRPDTSNLNFQAGQTIANTVLIQLGTGGRIQLFNGSYGTVQVIVDVTGYTRSGTPIAPGRWRR